MAMFTSEKILFLVGLVTLTFNYSETANAIKKTQDDQRGQLPFISKMSSNKVCCEIINEAEIDMKFFTELCKSVIEREMSTEAGIRMYRREEKYPPPGMMERCRKSIFEECHIDIRAALIENKAQKMALQNDTNKHSNQFQINITDCIVNLVTRKLTVTPRKIKEIILPSYIHQERPLFLGAPPENLALKEKGSPYLISNIFKDNTIISFEKINPKTAILSYVKEDKLGKAKIFILEPIYKLSVTIFFIFAMTKFLTKKQLDTIKPKVEENNHVHKNGNLPSIKNGKLHSKVSFDKEDEEIPSLMNLESEAADDMQTACEDLTEHCDDEIAEDKSISSQCDLKETPSMAESQKMFTSLANYLKNLIQTDDAKIAVLGMEVQAEFSEKLTSAKKQENPEPSSDVVEDAPSESTDEGVVVTGRMLISLLGKKKEGEFQQLAEHQIFTSVNTDG